MRCEIGYSGKDADSIYVPVKVARSGELLSRNKRGVSTMLCRSIIRNVAMAAVVAAAVGSADISADAQDFYAGKTMDMVIGGNPGSGYDIYSRLIAKKMPQYIPGHPAMIAKNMPGAGSNKASHFMAHIAPKDGTVIAAVYADAIMAPLLEDDIQLKFDPAKFVYLGTADSSTRVCITFHTAPVKTMEDLRAQKAIAGAASTRGSTGIYPLLVNNLAGGKFSIVTGYKGTVDILLAMERGEVEGLCGFDWPSLKAQKSDWLRDKKVNILVQFNLDPDPELTALGVPQVWKYVASEDDRQALELILSQQVFGRPYVAPPGIPVDRAKILRDAFMATMADKGFLADAEAAQLAIAPSSGEAVQKLVERLYAMSPAVVERAKKATLP